MITTGSKRAIGIIVLLLLVLPPLPAMAIDQPLHEERVVQPGEIVTIEVSKHTLDPANITVTRIDGLVGWEISSMSNNTITLSPLDPQPGRYIIRETEGNTTTTLGEFYYGVLAVNVPKTEYTPGDTAIAIVSVLGPDGMPYPAQPTLVVEEPDGLKTGVSCFETRQGEYSCPYRVEKEGWHEARVYAIVEGRRLYAETGFNASNSPGIVIERRAPTMIDPWNRPVRMEIRVATKNPGGYTLREMVPPGFNITSNSSGILVSTKSGTLIEWSLYGNATVYYEAKPPLETPALYTLGPATLEWEHGTYTEPRKWMLALDPSYVSQVNATTCQKLDYTTSETWTACSSPWNIDLDDSQYQIGSTRFNRRYCGIRTGYSLTLPDCTKVTKVEVAIDWYYTGSVTTCYGTSVSTDGGSSWTQVPGSGCPSTEGPVQYYDVTGLEQWDCYTFSSGNAMIRAYLYSDFIWGYRYCYFDLVAYRVTYTSPPKYDTWGLNTPNGPLSEYASVNRTDTVWAHAHWSDTLNNALLEHNGTGTPTNYTVTISGEWTNRTLDLSSPTEFPRTGLVEVKTIHANSTYGLWNSTAPPQHFYLWGFSKLSDIALSETKIYNGSYTIVYCRVIDNITGLPIQGYPVNFYSDTQGFLGTNTTNSTGWAVWNYVDNTQNPPVTYDITCNITGQPSLYYHASDITEKKATLDVMAPGTDITPPTITDVSAAPSTTGLGETVRIRANVTDDNNVTSVIVKITRPDSVIETHPMINTSGTIYEYNYTPWLVGEYYYLVQAEDQAGNIQTYDPYFYVNANARLTVSTVKTLYAPGDDVDLSPGVVGGEKDLSTGTQSASYMPGIVVDTLFYDGFESGYVYRSGTSNCQATDTCAQGYGNFGACDDNGGDYLFCSDDDGISDTGNTRSLRMIDWDTWDGTKGLMKTIDTSGFTDVELNFWSVANSLDNNNEYCEVTANDSATNTISVYRLNNGDACEIGTANPTPADWPSACHQRINLSTVSGLSLGGKITLHLGADESGRVDYCHYDEFTVKGYRYAYTYENNASWIEYNDTNGDEYDWIDTLLVTVQVDAYDPSGSIANGNKRPQLGIRVYDGSTYREYHVNLSTFYTGSTLDTTSHNFTIRIDDPAILSAWLDPNNRIVRVRGELLDYNDTTSSQDLINWSKVVVKYYTRNPSVIDNYGSTNLTGYLLIRVESNNTGAWQVVDTPIDEDTPRIIPPGTQLDLTTLWNPLYWDSTGYEPGYYRIHAVLRDEHGNVLVTSDGNSLEDTFVFSLRLLENATVSPNTTGYGGTVLLEVDVTDPSIVSSVEALVTYPNGTTIGFPMASASGGHYYYDFTDTWQWGDYEYRAWANTTNGATDQTDPIKFHVRANATIRVFTENKTYGPYEDVNVLGPVSDWWNTSWFYRTKVEIATDRPTLDWPVQLSVNFTKLLEDAGCNATCTLDTNSIRVIEYDSTGAVLYEVPSYFLPAEDFDPTTNANGTLIWIMNGTTPATTTRNYQIYYDTTTGKAPKQAPNYQYPAYYNRTSRTVYLDGEKVLKFDASMVFDEVYAPGSTSDLASGNAGNGRDKWYWSYNYYNTATTSYYCTVDDYNVIIDNGPMVWIFANVSCEDTYYNDALIKIYKRGQDSWVAYLEDWHTKITASGGNANVEFLLDIMTDPSGSGSWDRCTEAGCTALPNTGNNNGVNIEGYNWVRSYFTTPDFYVGFWTRLDDGRVVFDDTSWDWTVETVDQGVNFDRVALSDADGVAWPPSEFTYDLGLIVANTNGGYTDVDSFYYEYAYPPTVTVVGSEELNQSRVYNWGSTNITGRVIMRLQRLVDGSWVNYQPIKVDQATTIYTGGIQGLDTLWNPSNWDTAESLAGQYRIWTYLADPQGNILVNDDGTPIQGYGYFEILSPYLHVTSLEHENEYEHGVNEYETGDTIDWINVTIRNENATSLNTMIHLNVLDAGQNLVSWGPNEDKSCGNLAPGESCEERFDNNTNGYYIPLDATPGTYSFYWNVTMWSDNAEATYNTTATYKIHNIPSTSSSVLSPYKLLQGEWAWYNFTMSNPWSNNLTGVNITVNCPSEPTISCYCIGEGGQTCHLGNITPSGTITVAFNITTQATTPTMEYHINATIEYVNPGNESHTWTQQQDKLLIVKSPYLNVTIHNPPQKVTRGYDYKLNASVNNTDPGQETSYEIWFNWTLPAGWTNSTGKKNEFIQSLAYGETAWNNITASISTSAQLGPQQVRARAEDNGSRYDYDIAFITVYADTKNTPPAGGFSSNPDPQKGETITLTSILRYDNNTVIPGENVTFVDTTTGEFIGWDLTDSSGRATVSWTIPQDAPTGVHTINISFAGDDNAYLNPNWTTTTITVHGVPVIENVTDTPDPVGYGYDVNITADAYDPEGVDTVKTVITTPGGTQISRVMTHLSGNTYNYTYNGTWEPGTYSYYVWANNTAGKTNQTSTYTFQVRVNATTHVATSKSAYDQLENVYLSNQQDDWWNTSWEYRRQINVTENTGAGDVANYTMNVTFNPNGHVEPDCRDIRIVHNNVLVPYRVDACNPNGDTTVSFIVNVSSGATDTGYYVYYGNHLAADAQTPGITNTRPLSWETPHPYDSNTLYRTCNDGVCTSTWTTYYCYLSSGDTAARVYMRLQVEGGGYDPFRIYNQDSTATLFYFTDSGSGNDPVDWNNGEYGWTDWLSTPGLTGLRFELDTDGSANFWGVDIQKIECGMNNPPTLVVGSEEPLRNRITNQGTTPFKGYLTMKIQRYDSSTSSWVDVPGGLMVDMQEVNIPLGGYVDLDTIWNATPWNVGYSSPGTYRVISFLTDPSGTILRDEDGNLILATGEFTVNPPPVQLSVSNIRIYDVTNKTATHTDTSTLVGEGTNTTFLLYTNHTYRVEVYVLNDANSKSDWSLDSATRIRHAFLNGTWTIDTTRAIWYEIGATSYTGGSWSGGNVTWNNNLGGTLARGSVMTFYYVVNTTSYQNEYLHPLFEILQPGMLVEDHSTFRIVRWEKEPPQLYAGTYGLNATIVDRGDTVLLYARWNEEINQSIAEYNETSPQLLNHTIILPVPNPQNWTNHTIKTNSSWLLGNHVVKIYAQDLCGNWNNTLPYLVLDVWGVSNVTSHTINTTTPVYGSSIEFSCLVTSDNGSAISGYPVHFLDDQYNIVGVVPTNATGWATTTYTPTTLGSHWIACYVEDNATLHHHAWVGNHRNQSYTVIELEPPRYWQILTNATNNRIHKGESVIFSVNWTDNYMLDTAILSTNETGSWQNSTLAQPVSLTDSMDWSNYSVTPPLAMTPGVLGWRVYANDTSGNWNVTPVQAIEVWGWASVGDMVISPNPVYEGDPVNISCRVIDANTTSGIQGYTVYFYNTTHQIGVATTNSTGWARIEYTTPIYGVQHLEPITCNITDNATIYYNATSQNQKTQNLDTRVPGSDITPPFLYNNIYDISPTILWKLDTLQVWARWNETVYGANVTYNSTSPAVDQNVPITLPSPNPENWTNHSITIGADWLTGRHVIKVMAKDFYDNWNTTLPYKVFEVWGRSKAYWESPTGTVVRSNDIPLYCSVKDKNSGEGIPNYPVTFYKEWNSLPGGTVYTNASGIAVYHWDASSEAPGTVYLECEIQNNSTLYYNVTSVADSYGEAGINLVAGVDVAITSPQNDTKHHKGEMIWLNSTITDDAGNPLAPDTIAWYNSTTQIASQQNTTWTIPQGHALGPQVIKANATKQGYEPGEDTVTIIVWGYSNATWQGPPPGTEVSLGDTVLLSCLATDNYTGTVIQNYNVTFWVSNSTGTWYLGSNTTNSSGIAVFHWTPTTTSWSTGIYYPGCNTTSDETVYYDPSQYGSWANTTINITGPAYTGTLVYPNLTAPPDNTIVAQYRLFWVNATVNCSGDCGTVYGTVLVNNTPAPENSGTPFYTVGLNTKACPVQLSDGDMCSLSWQVNATGDLHTQHNISVLWNSSVTPENKTQNATVEIGIVIILVTNFTEVDFGDIPPGSTGAPALGNGGYGVWLDEASSPAEGLWIKGTNLTIDPYKPPTNCDPGQPCDNNRIPVWNVTWSKVDNQPASTPLSYEYQDLDGTNNPIPPGRENAYSLYYWIGIPPVQAGVYHGNLTIMANATY